MGPESKQQSVEWTYPQPSSKKKFKSQSTAGELMFKAFLRLTRPSTGTLSGEGHAINSEMLTNRLKACNSEKTLRTTVKRCCVVAPQCLPTLVKPSNQI
jgi:hypothetical protein